MTVQDIKSVKGAVQDKEKLIFDYERRLDISKNLLQQKDAELSSAKMQVMDLYDQFADEQEKTQKLQLRLSNLERENKALEIRYNAETQEHARLKDE